MAKKWYCNQDDQTKGPLTPKQLKELVAAGKIKATTPVWTKGMSEWKQARQITGLISLEHPLESEGPPPFTKREQANVSSRQESTSETATFRSQLAEGGKYAAVLGMFSGLAADFLTPLAPINMYLFGLASFLAIGLAIQWFRLPPDQRQHWDRGIPHQALVCCVVLVLTFGFWFSAQMLSSGEDMGALASNIDPIRELQSLLLTIGADVKDIKVDTTAIKVDTTAIKQDTTAIYNQNRKIGENVDGLGKLGGLINNPKTPADFYHNARIHELSGDFAAAFSAYQRYISFNQEFIDPYLSYLQLLRSQRGQQNAAYEYGKLRKVSPENRALGFVSLRLLSGDSRLMELESLSKRHSDFAPVLLDLANYYSAEEMPNRSGVDVDKERTWLEQFLKAAEQGGFTRYYLDKKQAEEMLTATRGRITRARTSVVTLEADKKVFLANWNQVWVMDSTTTLIEYSFDQKQWKPVANLVKTIMLGRGEIDDARMSDQQTTVYVRYTDHRGNQSQIYKIPVASVAERSPLPGLGQPIDPSRLMHGSSSLDPRR